MKKLSCRDVGVDCDFVARGKTEDEIFRQCAKHAKEAHGMDEIPEEHRVKMRTLIREETAA
jgi:predicted small metal-binding protein